MTTMVKLISIIARGDGRDEKTLKVMARDLRERGLLPTGLRGAGALHMTPRDAAVLLIALNCATHNKDAQARAETFLGLPSATGGRANPPPSMPSALAPLVRAATLTDAVVTLFRGVYAPGHVEAKVKLYVLTQQAEIEVSWVPPGKQTARDALHLTYSLPFDQRRDDWSLDRDVVIAFTQRTLKAVAEAIDLAPVAV
jgi:hypothetical protein